MNGIPIEQGFLGDGESLKNRLLLLPFIRFFIRIITGTKKDVSKTSADKGKLTHLSGMAFIECRLIGPMAFPNFLRNHVNKFTLICILQEKYF